jgi:hypothetical protein
MRGAAWTQPGRAFGVAVLGSRSTRARSSTPEPARASLPSRLKASLYSERTRNRCAPPARSRLRGEPVAHPARAPRRTSPPAARGRRRAAPPIRRASAARSNSSVRRGHRSATGRSSIASRVRRGARDPSPGVGLASATDARSHARAIALMPRDRNGPVPMREAPLRRGRLIRGSRASPCGRTPPTRAARHAPSLLRDRDGAHARSPSQPAPKSRAGGSPTPRRDATRSNGGVESAKSTQGTGTVRDRRDPPPPQLARTPQPRSSPR